MRSQYLDELLRLEGKGKADICCPDCDNSFPTIRCDDCHGGELVCKPCALARHHRHPLHRVNVCFSFWPGNTTSLTWSSRFGMAYFLNGSTCATWDFVFSWATHQVRSVSGGPQAINISLLSIQTAFTSSMSTFAAAVQL